MSRQPVYHSRRIREDGPMPELGLRMTGAPGDLAGVQRIAAAAPELVARAWRVLTAGAATFLCSDGLEAAAAEAGVELAQVEADHVRDAAHLLEALPPQVVPGEPAAEVACLRVDAGDAAAGRTLERLLLLDRPETRVAELEADGRRWLLAVVPAPPLYLLMRARDESEGVAAYARHGDSSLWVRWCHAHPLADLAAERLSTSGHSALVDADGRWHTLPADWRLRPIHDALRADLPAPRAVWTPATGQTRFTVRLRLEAGGSVDPELWLLSAEEMLRLEPLVDHAGAEELNRLTVARLLTPSGDVAYALRERVRARSQGLGVRVAEVLGRPGFSRVPGMDGLFVPVGRRLAPRMRPADLRAVLGLDEAPVVVVRETAGGPEVVHVGAAPEAPLSDWVDYVATDNRLVLDQLMEEMVFAAAAVEVDHPPAAARTVKPSKKRPARKRKRRAWLPRVVSAEAPAEAPDLVALRARAAELQQVVVAGACEDADVWAELGVALIGLNVFDDAGTCLETALFCGADVTEPLLVARGGVLEDEALLEQATADPPTAQQASHVGARLLADLVAERPLIDGLGARVLQLYGQAGLPVSRRLSWRVQHALHSQSGDRIGLARAREGLLGALNTSGLREATDAPRFVRYALAFGESEQSAAQAGQATALRALWAQLEQGLSEGDPQGILYRSIFAAGFSRVGDAEMWRPLGELVEEELPVHDGPVQALARLYLARIGDADDDRTDAVTALVAGLPSREQTAVAFYAKRSRWLRGEEPPPEQDALEPRWTRRIEEASDAPATLPVLLREALADRTTYDAHVARIADRVVHAALATGSDAVIASVHTELAGGHRGLALLAPKARVVGAALKMAAFLEDGESVDTLVEAVVKLAPRMDAVGQLLGAVEPALAALRRVGTAEPAERFLVALEQVARRDHPEAPKVGAFVADGFWMMGELERADLALREAIDAACADRLRYIPRYEAAAAALRTVRAWPAETRQAVGQRLLAALPHFTDTFTTRRYFMTHQALVVEGVVDAVSDARTFASARLRAWLEAEEQVVRRRILADWRAFEP